jgi:hypothetical protein
MSSSMGRIIYLIYEMDNKIHVWNHQPLMIDGYQWLLGVITNWWNMKQLMVTNGDDYQ